VNRARTAPTSHMPMKRNASDPTGPSDGDRSPPPAGGWADLPLGGAARASRGRDERFESILERALRERLARGLNDPRVQGLVSVVGVDLSPDRARATVRVSVLPIERGALTLAGLQSAVPHLVGFLRKATRLRTVPRLSFELDAATQRRAGIDEALRIARGETDAAEPPIDSEENP
jgi:ribosome-binding factor A